LSGSDGEVEAGLEGEDFGFTALMDAIDVLVMGRKTYELVLSSGQWPYANKRVIVLSRTLNKTKHRAPNTVELKSCSPEELCVELQNSGAKHLYIDGGKTIQGFLNAGLVDDLIVTTIPVLIGRGIPLFGSLNEDKKLSHLTTQFFKNGFVQSKYEIIN